MMLTRASWLFIALAMVGCGTTTADPDAGSGTDACVACSDSGNDPVDGGSDGGGDVDDAGQDGGGPDGGPADAGPLPIPADPVVASASTGHDRFFGVAFDGDGNIVAVGQTAPTIEATADHSILVARFAPDGTLDTTFGDDGFVTHNVAVGGRARELGRAVVVQSTGRIVVAGTAEHDVSLTGLLATDTDVVLVGFTPEGDLDTTFGEGGVVIEDLSTGSITVNASGTEVLNNNDDQWGLALAGADAIVVHARLRASGFAPDGVTPRTDTDWALLRLSEDGERDDTFSTDGITTLDIANANASARGVTVFADGSMLASGYTTSSALFPAGSTMTSQQPVLWKVLATGEPDATFATADSITIPGVWHDFVVAPPARAEAYGAAVQGDHLVTMGYGPPSGGAEADVISIRFSLTGALDTSYGTAEGHTYVDVAGEALRDNGHGVVVLPDGRVLGAGQGNVTHGTVAETDLAIVVLTEDGQPDTAFGARGVRTYDVRLNDQLWAVALSPDGSRIAAVGLAGAESSTDDDDAALLIVSTE